MYKNYLIGTDASTTHIPTKHGELNISCGAFTVYDYNQQAVVVSKSYTMVGESNNFAETYAITMAIAWFTMVYETDPRNAIIYSDSTVAIQSIYKHLKKFSEHRKHHKPKYGLREYNTLDSVAYNAAYVLWTSPHNCKILYVPGHSDNNDRISYFNDKLTRANDKIGIIITENTLPTIMRDGRFANTITDKHCYEELRFKSMAITDQLNMMDNIPPREE
jgi:ribonuclease HI